jgi:hypothetical protein
VSPRLRAAALNAGLAAASLLLGLLVLELGLRLLARGARGGKEQQEQNRYTEYDPVVGWRKTPGAHVVYERRDFQVEFDVNSQGLRGPERPYAKPAGVSRVLALGDSFVEAYTVSDGETVTARLEHHLEQKGCRVEVLNGGTIAYSTDQEYLFYREDGRKYAPDVVVLFVYHNDIPYLVLDKYFDYPKPLLDFESRPPVVSNAPVPRYVPPPQTSERAPVSPPSFLLEFVKDSLESASARTYESLARLGLWEPLRKLPPKEELNLFRVPELGHLRPAWSAFAWTVQSLSEAAREDGARLVVAYVPSKMEVVPRVWERTQVRYGLDASFERSAVSHRIRLITGRLRIPFLDLTPSFIRTDGLLSPVFFPTDGHWNARGQDVAARETAALVISTGSLSGCR